VGTVDFQHFTHKVLYIHFACQYLILTSALHSMFFATIFAMYVYIHASVPLFFLSIILFGFIMFVLLLCPLHQF